MKIAIEGTITVETLVKYFESVLKDGYGYEAAIVDLLRILKNINK